MRFDNMPEKLALLLSFLQVAMRRRTRFKSDKFPQILFSLQWEDDGSI
jgi:hypothetical protein